MYDFVGEMSDNLNQQLQIPSSEQLLSDFSKVTRSIFARWTALCLVIENGAGGLYLRFLITNKLKAFKNFRIG